MTVRQLLLPYIFALLLAALTPCTSHADAASGASTVVMAKVEGTEQGGTITTQSIEVQ